MNDILKEKMKEVSELIDLHNVVSDHIRILNLPKGHGVVASERLVRHFPHVNEQLKLASIQLFEKEQQVIEERLTTMLCPAQ